MLFPIVSLSLQHTTVTLVEFVIDQQPTQRRAAIDAVRKRKRPPPLIELCDNLTLPAACYGEGRRTHISHKDVVPLEPLGGMHGHDRDALALEFRLRFIVVEFGALVELAQKVRDARRRPIRHEVGCEADELSRLART